MKMPSLSNQQRAIIGIGIPVVALLFYLWYRRRRSSEFLDEEEEYARVGESETVASANQRTIEVKVPRSVVGAIIGKCGANIKKIEKDSGARVNLRDEEEGSENVNGERIVLVQGEREKAKRAEILVKKIIAEQPVVRTDEVFVPQRACGRIIGKGGQTIRNMSYVSGARIKIDSDSNDLTNRLRKCLITGTSDQIASAKGLLDEKIAEDNEIRNRRGDMGTYRTRRGPRKLDTAKVSQATGAVQFPKANDFYEVFVSAIDNPGHFWVQLITEDSPQLDKLTNDLTALYSSSESTTVLNAFKEGDICCAPFEFDASWYRARILEINKGGTVGLYYVDFGDSGQISKEKLRELKQEQRRLPFQAIECFLAGVKPTGDKWSQEATDDFERLSHCAEWVPLMARVVKYSGEVPCLELIDTTGHTDVNISEEMIKRQFAVQNVLHSSEEQDGELAEALSKDAGNGLQETPEATKPDIPEQRESSSPVAKNGDLAEETPIVSLESAPRPNSSDTLSEAASKDVGDGPPSVDVTDSSPALSGPAVPETDSPVKAALVKTISNDYMPVATNSSALLSAPDGGPVADLGVVKEQGIVELHSRVGKLDVTESTKVEEEKEGVLEGAVDLEPTVHSLEEKPVGYRSSLNIAPSSKRTMAASFTGSRVLSERNESSTKTVTSTVHRQVVTSKQSYVSTVTLPEHSHNGNVLVSVAPSVTQLTEQSPFVLDGHSFRASNESTTLTYQTVTSEVQRTATQASRGDTAGFNESPLKEKLTAHSSSSGKNQRVTYEINFQGTPGKDPYTVKKTYPSCSQNAERISPSGSLLELSTNTVIDEEEEYEQEQEDKRNDSAKSTGSESPEADSDTESFMSAKEDITSDTDAAAYMTAGGSSTSLYNDAVSPNESATEDPTTPVNSDTEVEEVDDKEETGGQGSATPRQLIKEDGEQGGSETKGLREQTLLLGSGVTSDAEIGYRADTEEGLASTEDLRTTGT